MGTAPPHHIQAINSTPPACDQQTGGAKLTLEAHQHKKGYHTVKHISRHNRTGDWHIKCANGVWKVYDKDQKYRCGFRTREEAEQYIDQHRTRRLAA